MGRVFCKMKFDRGIGIELPHSWNFANALYGFGEMGAEVIPYHSLDEVYDQVEREDIVLNYIEQCQEIFQNWDSPLFTGLSRAADVLSGKENPGPIPEPYCK